MIDLPNKNTRLISMFLDELVENKDAIGWTTYDLSIPTLADVFEQSAEDQQAVISSTSKVTGRCSASLGRHSAFAWLHVRT